MARQPFSVESRSFVASITTVLIGNDTVTRDVCIFGVPYEFNGRAIKTNDDASIRVYRSVYKRRNGEHAYDRRFGLWHCAVVRTVVSGRLGRFAHDFRRIGRKRPFAPYGRDASESNLRYRRCRTYATGAVFRNVTSTFINAQLRWLRAATATTQTSTRTRVVETVSRFGSVRQKSLADQRNPTGQVQGHSQRARCKIRIADRVFAVFVHRYTWITSGTSLRRVAYRLFYYSAVEFVRNTRVSLRFCFRSISPLKQK